MHQILGFIDRRVPAGGVRIEVLRPPIASTPTDDFAGLGKDLLLDRLLAIEEFVRFGKLAQKGTGGVAVRGVSHGFAPRAGLPGWAG